MPRSLAAATSTAALNGPVEAIIFSRRQALDDVTRQRCALPHDAHHVERRQPLNDGVWVGEVIVEHGDLGSGGHVGPVGHAQRDVLVVIEDRDPHCANLAYLVWPVGRPGSHPDARQQCPEQRS